jgi:hypothetical protein
MDWWDSYYPYLLTCETTDKGTGLIESAGKEDLVLLDSKPTVLNRHGRCTRSASRKASLKYHHFYRFLIYSVKPSRAARPSFLASKHNAADLGRERATRSEDSLRRRVGVRVRRNIFERYSSCPKASSGGSKLRVGQNAKATRHVVVCIMVGV